MKLASKLKDWLKARWESIRDALGNFAARIFLGKAGYNEAYQKALDEEKVQNMKETYQEQDTKKTEPEKKSDKNPKPEQEKEQPDAEVISDVEQIPLNPDVEKIDTEFEQETEPTEQTPADFDVNQIPFAETETMDFSVDGIYDPMFDEAEGYQPDSETIEETSPEGVDEFTTVMQSIWEKNDKIENLQDFNLEQLQAIDKALGEGVEDLEYHITPEYKAEQIEWLIKGLQNGIDISVYEDPELPASEMERIYMTEKEHDKKEPDRAVVPTGTEPGVIREIREMTDKIENLEAYNFDQLTQIKYGLRDNIPLDEYVSPEYDAIQIAELSMGLTEGLDIAESYADPKISSEEMMALRQDLENKKFAELGYDNNKYDQYQKQEILLGIWEGKDVSQYDDPAISSYDMCDRRNRMEPMNNRFLSESQAKHVADVAARMMAGADQSETMEILGDLTVELGVIENSYTLSISNNTSAIHIDLDGVDASELTDILEQYVDPNAEPEIQDELGAFMDEYSEEYEETEEVHNLDDRIADARSHMTENTPWDDKDDYEYEVS